MNPEFDEVLLTAYLDNEVDDAERAAVEEHLQKSESARKLFEELKAIRNMVAQLHRSEPSRNWQNGPWSSTAIPSSEPRSAVQLPATPTGSWKTVYPRLASLAALIAVAVCSTILVMNPKYISIARFESTGSANNAKQSKESIRIEPPNQAETLEGSDGAAMDSVATEPETDVPSFSLNRSAKGATGTELSFKKGEDRRPDFKKSDENNTAETQRGSDKNKVRLGAPSQPAPTPSLASPSLAAPSPQSRSSDGGVLGGDLGGARMNERGDYRLRTDPKSLAPPSVGMTSLGEINKEQSDPSLSLWVNAYFDETKQDQPNLYAIDDFVLEDALSRNAKDENVQLGKSAKQEHAADRFSWRFEPNDRGVGQMLASEAIAPRSNEAGKPERKTDSLESSDKGILADSPRQKEILTEEKKELPKTLHFEFQIPRENWAAGANRLRQLGINVPLELPNDDILEFMAKRTSVTPPTNDAKTALLGLEMMMAPLNRELEPEALLRENPSVVRVRVRVK